MIVLFFSYQLSNLLDDGDTLFEYFLFLFISRVYIFNSLIKVSENPILGSSEKYKSKILLVNILRLNQQ